MCKCAFRLNRQQVPSSCCFATLQTCCKIKASIERRYSAAEPEGHWLSPPNFKLPRNYTESIPNYKAQISSDCIMSPLNLTKKTRKSPNVHCNAPIFSQFSLNPSQKAATVPDVLQPFTISTLCDALTVFVGVGRSLRNMQKNHFIVRAMHSRQVP